MLSIRTNLQKEANVAETIHIPDPDFNVELVQGSGKKAVADAEAKSRDLYMVPIGNIKVVKDFNVRIRDAEYAEHVDEIKESIKSNGFFAHFPLKGYPGKEGDITFIYCVGGFTRLLAAKAAIAEGAAIESLPVVLVPPGTNSLDLMFGLDTDNTGNRLKPYERAIVIKRAINFGATIEDCATRMGLTEQYINNLLYLMSLPNQLQKQVAMGRASADTVIQLSRKEGTEAALQRLESAAPTSTTGKAEDGPTAAPRVTAKRLATDEPKIPHKQLMAAVRYAIDLPGDGLDFLRRFLAQEGDAKKELRTHLKPPKAAKPAKGKSKVVDPFDITPRRKVAKPGLRKKEVEAEAPL